MITGKPNIDPARTGEKIETSEEMMGILLPPMYLSVQQSRFALPHCARKILRLYTDKNGVFLLWHGWPPNLLYCGAYGTVGVLSWVNS